MKKKLESCGNRGTFLVTEIDNNILQPVINVNGLPSKNIWNPFVAQTILNALRSISVGF